MEIYYPDGNGGRTVIVIGEGSSSLPTMNATLKGGAKVGENLYMTSESLNASLPTASNIVKGGAKIGYGLEMTSDGTLVVTLSGGRQNTFDEYGKVVVVPETTSALPTVTSAIDALEDWTVINTATYDDQADDEGWSGDVIIVLPQNFAQRHYTITHIHNEDDYSEIFTKESYVYVEDGAKGYTVEKLGKSTRYGIKVPAVSIHWQTDETPTQLVIHGGYDGNVCPYFPCFVPGEGVTLENNILNCTIQPYTLPAMNETLRGGAKVGNTLVMTNSAEGADVLNVALGTTPLTLEGSMWLHVPD